MPSNLSSKSTCVPGFPIECHDRGALGVPFSPRKTHRGSPFPYVLHHTLLGLLQVLHESRSLQVPANLVFPKEYRDRGSLRVLLSPRKMQWLYTTPRSGSCRCTPCRGVPAGPVFPNKYRNRGSLRVPAGPRSLAFYTVVQLDWGQVAKSGPYEAEWHFGGKSSALAAKTRSVCR